MKSTKRIILSIVILIGGTLVFAYWAVSSFDAVFFDFDKLSRNNQPNFNLAKNEQIEVTASGLTDSSVVVLPNNELTKKDIIQDIKDLSLKFILPKRGIDLYRGCKYRVSWIPSSEVNFMELALIDVGTSKAAGSISSGIPKNISGKNLENFEWKVGTVWPGEYYILTSQINNSEFQDRSPVFNIKEIPVGANKEEIEKICESSSQI